ncbi:MAG: hypothetical protein V4508_10750 [Pseudomonadota bacterium]
MNSELGTLFSGYAYQGSFITNFTDARGHTTLTQYQAFDQPSQAAPSSISAPLGVVFNIARDVFGKPLAIVRSGGGLNATRSYVYDANQRLCKTVEPETGATIQDYDLANNVTMRASGLALTSTFTCDTASVPANKKITTAFNTMKRPTTTTYGDASPSVTRTYWSDGLPNTIVSNGSTWTNIFNKRRLNTLEDLLYGAVHYQIARVYDANASLLQLKYPIDNLAIDYLPNALGEPSKIGTYASAITYYPNGAVNTFIYGNGIVHSSHQNTRQLPDLNKDMRVTNDSYTYDANGNVAGIVDGQLNIANRAMGYDDLDRLTSVSAPQDWGTASYGYDGLDNLNQTTITGGTAARTSTHTIDPVTNRLTGISGGPAAFNFSYGYDSQGNATNRGSQSYVFDQANRMTAATGKATYAYDGLGHRFSVVGTDLVNRIQVYSQAGQLLQTGAAGTTGTRYIYLHQHVIAEVAGGVVTYAHTDGLGSPVAQTAVSRTKRNTGLINSVGRMLQQCDVLSINDERRFIS